MNNSKSVGEVPRAPKNSAGPKKADTKKLDNNLRAVVGTCQKFGQILGAGMVILFGISTVCSIWRDNLERKRIKANNKEK